MDRPRITQIAQMGTRFPVPVMHNLTLSNHWNLARIDFPITGQCSPCKWRFLQIYQNKSKMMIPGFIGERSDADV